MAGYDEDAVGAEMVVGVVVTAIAAGFITLGVMVSWPIAFLFLAPFVLITIIFFAKT
jgi:hypothetical protein